LSTSGFVDVDYHQILFKKDISPKGETKHPAKILPGDRKEEPLPWGSQREFDEAPGP